MNNNVSELLARANKIFFELYRLGTIHGGVFGKTFTLHKDECYCTLAVNPVDDGKSWQYWIDLHTPEGILDNDYLVEEEDLDVAVNKLHGWLDSFIYN
jgi:hypothetical protein